MTIGISGAAMLASLVHGASWGQQPAGVNAARQEPAAIVKTKMYYGVSECRKCHSDPDAFKDDPPILCRCNEVPIWSKQDKHKDAYANLFKERGGQMTQLLKYKTNEQVEKNCVSCHGVKIEDPKLKHPSFKAEDGVSCVVCHGAYAEWVDLHGGVRRLEWRKKCREEKERVYGMTDLWDPAKRTRMCASCHIGNAQDGKVVTHEMYAAGHPPLPGFEVATFSDAMPRHWQYLREKSKAAKEILNYNPLELEQTKLTIVAGPVVLREAMHLLTSQATDGKTRALNERTLDLAQFDCYACHHELRVHSWRQARGYAGTPGRPQFRPWPLALIQLGVQHAGQESEAAQFQKKLGKLHKAFETQPFGALDAVTSAAGDLAEWCDRLAKTLQGKAVKYDRAAALGLLERLCSLAGSETADYDTARQQAWAFRIIYCEIDPKPASHEAILKKLKALDEELQLSLPSGQNRQILQQLPLTLEKIGAYDPKPFRDAFRQLAELVRQK